MYERKFRLQMTVRERDMQTIFDLLKDVAQDFKMIELTDSGKTNGTPLPTAFEKHKREVGSRWALRIWQEIEPLFRAEREKGDGLIRYDDPRLRDILVKMGHNAHTVTPLLSELRQLKLLNRPHRGWYQLPEKAA